MKRLYWITLVIFLSGACFFAHAEDVSLEKIVVTASRTETKLGDTAQKVDCITSKVIEESASTDLAQAIGKQTSVTVSNYGGIGAVKTVHMRGSTASQILVLVDGRPINSPRDGETDFSSIGIDNVERVEVMHGAASSLYGSQAMGGTINIITKNPPKKGFKTSLLSTFGTYHTYNEQLSHGGKVGDFGYIISGGYQDSQGHRANSGFHAKDANAKFTYDLNSQNNLILNTGFYRSRAGAPGRITAPDSDDQQRIIKNFQDLTWIFKPDSRSQIKTKLYQNYDRLEFIENSAGSIFDTANKKDIHATIVRGLDLQLDHRFADAYQIVTGLNYIKNYNDSTSSAKHDYSVKAFYLENLFEFFNRLNINISTRVDDYSNFGTEVNPSASVLFKIDENNSIHASIARSFRAPTFNDLYWPDEGWAKGNPDLQPEKGTSGEIGFQTKTIKNITTDITYYRSGFRKLIQWADNGSGVWQPMNVNTALIEGVEVENTLLLPWNLEAKIGYTLLRARDNKLHQYLVYQPKNRADLSLVYKKLDDIRVELTGQFTDTRFYDTSNEITVKRFFLLGLNINKKINDNLRWIFSINNLLNKKYQVIRDYPEPGFAVNSGIKLEF